MPSSASGGVNRVRGFPRPQGTIPEPVKKGRGPRRTGGRRGCLLLVEGPTGASAFGEEVEVAG